MAATDRNTRNTKTTRGFLGFRSAIFGKTPDRPHMTNLESRRSTSCRCTYLNALSYWRAIPATLSWTALPAQAAPSMRRSEQSVIGLLATQVHPKPLCVGLLRFEARLRPPRYLRQYRK